MTRREAVCTALVAVGVILGLAMGCGAVRVLPAALHLEQAAGSQEGYILTLINDTESPEDLRLYIGDWRRFENGEHDWGVPINGARWRFDRSFDAGEEVTVRYSIQLPDSAEILVQGGFQSDSPEVSAAGPGTDRIAADVDTPAVLAADDRSLTVTRVVESVDAAGRATVLLTLRFGVSLRGLTLYETFPERAQIESLDAGGAAFHTINRSNADWLSLSHDRLVLEPGERRDVTLLIDAPAGIDGTYWSAVFVESQPRIEDSAGTRVLSIYRTAIKIYVTALGTGRMEGRVTDVRVAETAPLTLEAAFENPGTVELVVTGEVTVVDRTGTTVRELTVEEFKILPGALRIVLAADAPDAPPLSADIYQAIVSFDYGGDGPVVGVRGFRVRD